MGPTGREPRGRMQGMGAPTSQELGESRERERERERLIVQELSMSDFEPFAAAGPILATDWLPGVTNR